MSLVNDSLKFISSDMQIFWYFLLKKVSSFCSAKATHIFSAKNIRILCIEPAKTVTEMTFNELVKLTTLWTTGPCTLTVLTSIWIPYVSKRGFGHEYVQRRFRPDSTFALSDQNRHWAHLGEPRMQSFFMWTTIALIRLRGRAGWFESSFGAHIRMFDFSRLACNIK